jgi:hypothetical protein
MIVPPISTQSFYTALLEKNAAQFIVNLLSPSNIQDVDQVLIVSQSINSDVQATNELLYGVNEVMLNIANMDEHIETTVMYNPLYLPKADTLAAVDFDNNGNILTVDGFASPFISMTIKTNIKEQPPLIDAKVNYKQFELPMIANLENKHTLLS